MGAVIVLIICGYLVIFALLMTEPPTIQQCTNEAKRKIEYEKEQGMAEIDAITKAHERQVFEMLSWASQQIIEKQAKEARQRAEDVMAQATKEN